jgi:hypothetical protein
MTRIAALVLCTLPVACQATAPTAPSPVLSGVAILYNTASRPGESFQLKAFAVDSDGAYTEVTEQAQWTSSNAGIASINPGNFVGGKSVSANSPGTTVITAVYQSVSGFLPVRVPMRPNPSNVVGPLRLEPARASLNGAGAEVRLTVSFSASGRSSDVTTAATWTSSEPTVATVDRGVVTAQRVGTTEIVASYEGASDSYWMSVHPSRERR